MSSTAPSRPATAAWRRSCAGLVAAMVALAFAAVPLYQAFCQATGFDGTVRRAASRPTGCWSAPSPCAFDANVRDIPGPSPPSSPPTVRIGDNRPGLLQGHQHQRLARHRHAAYKRRARERRGLFPQAGVLLLPGADPAARPKRRVPVVYFIDPKWPRPRNRRHAARSPCPKPSIPATGR